MDKQVMISASLLGLMMDLLVRHSQFNPAKTEEEQDLQRATSIAISKAEASLTQGVANPRSFSGSEIGSSSIDPTKSNYL